MLDGQTRERTAVATLAICSRMDAAGTFPLAMTTPRFVLASMSRAENASPVLEVAMYTVMTRGKASASYSGVRICRRQSVHGRSRHGQETRVRERAKHTQLRREQPRDETCAARPNMREWSRSGRVDGGRTSTLRKCSACSAESEMTRNRISDVRVEPMAASSTNSCGAFDSESVTCDLIQRRSRAWTGGTSKKKNHVTTSE